MRGRRSGGQGSPIQNQYEKESKVYSSFLYKAFDVFRNLDTPAAKKQNQAPCAGGAGGKGSPIQEIGVFIAHLLFKYFFLH
jgi:hypothetical protein